METKYVNIKSLFLFFLSVNFHSGPGHLLQVVEYLQPECDRQANQILAEFRRTRQLDKQIRQVSEATANSKYRTELNL